MQTILHQGKPGDGDHWLVLPERFVPTYRNLGYGVRELVLRSDAERAEQAAFITGLERAARLADQSDKKLAAQIRGLMDQRVRATA